MMKKMMTMTAVFLLMTLMLCSCAGVPANTVFKIDDMKGKSIGVQLGTTGDAYVTDYETKDEYKDANGNLATIERYKKGSDAVMALKQGKIDCVVIDQQTALAFVENNDGLKILKEPFADEDYAIAVKKGNTELKEKINAALKQLQENGTIDQIIKNFIGDDTKGTCPYVSPKDVKHDNGKLIMATNAEFPPYEFVQEGKVVGIDAQIAQAIADVLGMELVIDDMDFDAIIAAVESGKADMGLAGMTVTEDRLESVDFTDPYVIDTKQVIVVRAD